MYSLILSEGAESDLDDLWQDEETAAADIEVLLQEVQGSQYLLDMLTAHDFGAHESEKFHVSKWFGQQNKGRNLWRLKVWDLEKHGLKYRVIYALDPRVQRYHILGIVHRDFDYDENDERTVRIFDEYDRLDIPTYS